MAIKRDKPWQVVEQVVALLERAIGAGAQVRHDVQLRSLSTGQLRQFDVVVEAGQRERRILTVVEVQKRKKRVGVPSVEAWWAKAESVGAHQLVCVSEAGFSSTVIREVQAKHGPRVRLVQLRDLERANWPINFVSGQVEVTCLQTSLQAGKTAVLDIPDISPVRTLPNVSFDALLFHRDGTREALSLARLVHDAVQVTPELTQRAPGTYVRNVQIPTVPALWISHEGALHPVRALAAPAQVQVIKQLLPLRFTSYAQVGEEHPLAWAALAEGHVAGDAIEVRVVFTPNVDGSFHVGAFQAVGIEERVHLAIVPGPLPGGSSAAAVRESGPPRQ
jgi:hypothetical protein